MLDQLLKPEIMELIRERDLRSLRQVLTDWTAPEIAGLMGELPSQDGIIAFRILPRELATDTFEYLPFEKQEELIEALGQREHRLAELLNDLSPDDRTSLLEELPGHVAQRLLQLLSPEEQRIAITLLGYPEESVGRLMTPEYVAVRPTWTVQKALDHIRRYGRDSETLDVIYVTDNTWHLLDDLRIRELLLVNPASNISDLLDYRFVALTATDDQETAVAVFRDYDRVALPVTDTQGVLLGILTVDDVLDVAEAEATEDIHKMGGSEALEEPYLTIPMLKMIRKRSVWLILLFFGQMLTATAMGYFEDELSRAMVLAIFVPLIISSGGNSGSQAATLVIRSLTIGEIRLRDWWRVMQREIFSGLAIGGILGLLGFLRIASAEWMFSSYGPFWPLIGLTICFSLLGVVLWGTLAGSLLPLILKRMGADPATSSTPFVATLVDVTGLVIYFSVAALMLSGSLL